MRGPAIVYSHFNKIAIERAEIEQGDNGKLPSSHFTICRVSSSIKWGRLDFSKSEIAASTME